MIQNLKNKMELQINSLETRTEKVQEMFNKDLEEIKKKLHLLMQEVHDPSLVGELRFHMHPGQKNKKHKTEVTL